MVAATVLPSMTFPAAALTSKTARCGLTLVGCLLLSLAVTSAASASVDRGSSGSVSQMLKRSLAAATKAGSAKISVQFFSGSTTGKVVQDSSLHSGEQTVAIGKELASTALVGGTAYISGNSKGFSSYFGLPRAVVPTLAGRWVSVLPTDSAFQGVTANVALPSALAAVTPSGTLVAGKRSKVDRQWVTSISGQAPGGGGRLTLFVAANARSLPVEAVESSRTGKTAKGEIVKFSRWGEPVHVVTPSGALPLSAIQAASLGLELRAHLHSLIRAAMPGPCVPTPVAGGTTSSCCAAEWTCESGAPLEVRRLVPATPAVACSLNRQRGDKSVVDARSSLTAVVVHPDDMKTTTGGSGVIA